MIHDPISDMITRIRNAVRIERPFVDIPLSRLRVGVADVLKREGYIWDYTEVEAEPGDATAARVVVTAPADPAVVACVRTNSTEPYWPIAMQAASTPGPWPCAATTSVTRVNTVGVSYAPRLAGPCTAKYFPPPGVTGRGR